MDLLGGYGSGSDSDTEDQPTSLSRLPAVSAAPAAFQVPAAPDSPPHKRQNPAPLAQPAPPLVRPKLVAGSGFHSSTQGDDSTAAVGPVPPPRAPAADETEIPGSSQPDEVWSKLPAPKAPQRRVVSLHLPFNKALLLAGKEDLLKKGLQDDDDDDEADRARAKRLKTGAGGAKSGLMGFLPPPKHAGRIDIGFDAAAARRAAGNGSTAAAGAKQEGAAGAKSGAAPAAAMMSNEAFRVRHGDSDEDDEDPMARMGPMPEAGAFAAGPVADEGEDIEPHHASHASAGPAADAGPAAGPSRPPQPWGGAQGYEHQQYDAPQYGAQQYAGQQYGALQYDAQQYAQYYGQDAGAYHAGAAGGQYGAALPETGDAGQDLLAHALAAEQQRAARKGKGVDLGGVQFKEVSAVQLRHMEPSQREAAESVRQALGSEYAVKLRMEAKSHEGSKMAKRKHQIGTLFFNAKMKELEIMEGKAHQMRTKSETQAKYGW